MAAAANGMAVSGLLPFVGTFFVFSDYMRPAVRLAAMMRAKVAFVWTHDSVGLGEDGPTHQPIEQLASLRAMPGLRLIRRADANEVAAAWRVHIDGDGPTAIILTRQKVPVLDGTAERAPKVSRAARTCSSTKTATRPTSCSSAPVPRCRSASGARELLAARGHRGARRVDAVVGPVRGAARRLPRRRCCRPGTPTLAVEAGVELRLDEVRRRRRRASTASANPRPATSRSRSSGTPPRTSPSARSRCWERTRHDAVRSPGSSSSVRAPGTTTSPARSHAAACATSSPSTASAASRRTRRSSRRRWRPAPTTTSSSASSTAAGASTRGGLLGRSSSATSPTRPTSCGPHYDEWRRRRRLRLDRGRPRSRARHRGHARPGEGAVRPARPAQRDDQDPGDPRRAARRSPTPSPPASTSTSR